MKEQTTGTNILVIGNNLELQNCLSGAFSERNFITFCPEEKIFFENIKTKHYSLIFLTMDPNQEDPLALLSWIQSTLPYTPVIVTSRTVNTELTVQAIKAGAFDFLASPFSAEMVQHTANMALENRSLKNEIDYLRHRQDIIYSFDRIIAFTPAMQDLINTLRKFSETDSTILMTGETGTGKSLLAGTVHFNSHRRKRPFVKINCSNIPENLLESELFGHERGAFTGADKLRIGRFEQANEGTLFLDEIGEMSLTLQTKLLRILEEKAFERLGSNKTIYTDVRVIAATNKDLKQMITAGIFREDLYYRLNVLPITLPPLRARKECIPPLSTHLLEKTKRSVKKNIKGFAPEIIEWMQTYPWPGNIRQMANVIERAAILEESEIIQISNIHIPETITPPTTLASPPPTTPSVTQTDSEKETIINALEESLWVQKDAAAVLGISPRMLNHKIKKLGITHKRWRANK